MRTASKVSARRVENSDPPESEILIDGRPTGTVVSGAVLEAAVEAGELILVFMTDDEPFEEFLSIHLLDGAGHLLDTAQLGAAYSTGTFSDLRLEAPRRTRFRFFGDTDWTVDILPQRALRLPWPAEAPGVWRRFGFRRHFIVGGKPRPGEQQSSAQSIAQRGLPLLLFALLGIATGMAFGALSIVFVPDCGEDCVNERLGPTLQWAVLWMVTFPLVAYLATRSPSARPVRRYWLIAGGLCLATLLPALAYYAGPLAWHRFGLT